MQAHMYHNMSKNSSSDGLVMALPSAHTGKQARSLAEMVCWHNKERRGTWLLAAHGHAEGSGPARKQSCTGCTMRTEMHNSAVCAEVSGERRGSARACEAR